MFLIRDQVAPRTWLALTHHVAGLVIGFLFLGALIGITVSAALVPLGLVSLPILGLMLRCADGLAAGERVRFDVLLGTRIPGWQAARGAATAGWSSPGGSRSSAAPPGARSPTRSSGCRSAWSRRCCP